MHFITATMVTWWRCYFCLVSKPFLVFLLYPDFTLNMWTTKKYQDGWKTFTKTHFLCNHCVVSECDDALEILCYWKFSLCQFHHILKILLPLRICDLLGLPEWSAGAFLMKVLVTYLLTFLTTSFWETLANSYKIIFD